MYLIADWNRLRSVIEHDLMSKVFKLLGEQTQLDKEGQQLLNKAMTIAIDHVDQSVSTLSTAAADCLSQECSAHIKHVQDVPRFYRRMNRDVCFCIFRPVYIFFTFCLFLKRFLLNHLNTFHLFINHSRNGMKKQKISCLKKT